MADRWRRPDDDILRLSWYRGDLTRHIARRLGRTERGVRWRRALLGLPTRYRIDRGVGEEAECRRSLHCS